MPDNDNEPHEEPRSETEPETPDENAVEPLAEPVLAAAADLHGGQVSDLLIEEEMRKSYLTYAMSVIVARALPDIRDGLKPSQRRLLTAMNDLNLGPRAKHRKCAKICGDTSGNYHPHGESVLYPTLVRLAQPWNLRYPLVDGQGNFGSINPDPPAAMRYTEARMTAPATDLLTDLEYDTVEFVPNYDETRQEPTVLPGKLPNLLINGSQGIAVGMATNIPSHNLGEICDAIVHLIENPACTVADLMQFVKGPDFPSGAYICGRRGLTEAYNTGRGSLVLRAKTHIENENEHSRIVVDELPYQVGLQRLVDSMVQAAKTGKIQGISDVRDESSKEGLRVVVELKRAENPHVVLNRLFKYTPLESSFHIVYLALVHGRPRLLNLKSAVEEYVRHRREVIVRRTRFLLARAEEHAHLLEGLIVAVDHIDDVIGIIRNSPNTETARTRLREKYEFSKRQAQAILDMPLRRLTGLEREKLKQEYRDVTEKIVEYRAILADDNLVLDIIKEDIYELKEKYGDPRRTGILEEAGELSMEELVADEVMVTTITHKGYCKREALADYRLQGRGGKGVIGQASKKDQTDFPAHIFVASTHDYLLFFTNDGRLYQRKVWDLPQLGRTAQGRALVNLLDLTAGQRVVSVVPVKDFKAEAAIAVVTRAGYIKKCKLADYYCSRRTGISAVGLNEGDEVLAAEYVEKGREIFLATRKGMAVRFDENVIRNMGRAARGVKGPKLAEGDRLVSVVVGQAGDSVFTVCEKGVGKRSALSNYRKVASQRAKGVINIKITEKNGPVVGVVAVRKDDEVMLIAAGGKVIRSRVSDVRQMGRGTVGVSLMNLEPGEKITDVARIAQDDAVAAHEQADARKADAAEEAARRNGS